MLASIRNTQVVRVNDTDGALQVLSESRDDVNATSTRKTIAHGSACDVIAINP